MTPSEATLRIFILSLLATAFSASTVVFSPPPPQAKSRTIEKTAARILFNAFISELLNCEGTEKDSE
jgi:hypothetical protein